MVSRLHGFLGEVDYPEISIWFQAWLWDGDSFDCLGPMLESGEGCVGLLVLL